MLKNFFKKKDVQVGEIYTENTNNPFEESKSKVIVVSKKDGWVKYKFVDGIIEFADPISAFLRLYKK